MRDLAERPTSCEMAEVRSPCSSTRLTREQVVDRIITINRSASPAFLEKFAEPQLRHYLEHLTHTEQGRNVPWIRRGETPAIVGRRADSYERL
ncbi:MAG: hypothetical protein RIB58_00410 [Phycisphaerales bacterium]